MVLLQRSWPCSRYRPQPTALPRAREMHSQAPGGGDMLTLCVPGCLTMAIFCPDVPQKRPRTGKRPLRGNISPPCIQNELALARSARHVSEKSCKSPLEDTPREYLARKGPLFAAQTPRIMHGAQILPRFSFRKALRTEGKRSWVSQAHFVLRPTVPPHDRVRLRQPCAITAAAALWPVAQTHGSQCCGERAVQRCVCASCPAASARPQRVSRQRYPPACSNLRRRRFSAAARPMTAACPHGASRSTAATRTSSVGGAPPRRNTKNGQRLLAVFSRL